MLTDISKPAAVVAGLLFDHIVPSEDLCQLQCQLQFCAKIFASLAVSH